MLRTGSNVISTWVRRRWVAADFTATLVLVGACGVEIKSDRQEARDRANGYLAAHPDTNPTTAYAIRNLELVAGMTPIEVTAAWGRPVIIERSIKGISELWYFPCFYPHFCLSRGARGGRHEEDQYQSRAFFVEGILTEWQQ